jgi:predicted DNA binding protein
MNRPLVAADVLKEVRFRFRHEGCWLQETTERHPSLMLVASAVYMVGSEVHMNVSAHSPQPDAVTKAFTEWSRDPRIKKVTRLGGGAQGMRFHVAYQSPHSIYVHILEHTPVALGAIRFAQGIENYQIMGESTELHDLLAVLGKKGTVEVLSIRDVQDLGVEDAATAMTAGLTDKQLEALVIAHQAGYYQWPRSSSASDVAERLGLSSSAFLDQLRHAEIKVIGAVISELALREPGRIETIKSRRKAAPGRKSP